MSASLSRVNAEYRVLQSAIATTDDGSPRRALLMPALARLRAERTALIEGRAAERPNTVPPLNRRKLA